MAFLDPSKQNLPVAFAANALYVLERNGAGSPDCYSRVILPVLKAKADYLHAEGVAQAAWGLASAQIWDKELWAKLSDLVVNHKDFDYKVVKNKRWSAICFETLNRKEHFFESELTAFTDDLFFQGKALHVKKFPRQDQPARGVQRTT